MKALLILLFSLCFSCANAQEIAGIIYNAQYEPLTNVHIKLLKYRNIMYSGNTAHDGSYSIQSIDPGSYDMLITHGSFDTLTCLGVVIPQDWKTTINFELRRSQLTPTNLIIRYRSPVYLGNGSAFNNHINRGELKYYHELIENPTESFNHLPELAMTPLPPHYILDVNIIQPLQRWPKERFQMIDLENPTVRIFTHAEIAQMPTRNVNDMLALLPGMYQNRPGDDLRIYGARREGTLYILDGMQLPW